MFIGIKLLPRTMAIFFILSTEALKDSVSILAIGSHSPHTAHHTHPTYDIPSSHVCLIAGPTLLSLHSSCYLPPSQY